mmetsp:Transcript_7891/g.16259  ORF Transcript_7891/g.16259 Transcript_7891/m.16259 type:complete len:266 (-) Transcript_7891:310-1107(-)
MKSDINICMCASSMSGLLLFLKLCCSHTELTFSSYIYYGFFPFAERIWFPLPYIVQSDAMCVGANPCISARNRWKILRLTLEVSKERANLAHNIYYFIVVLVPITAVDIAVVLASLKIYNPNHIVYWLDVTVAQFEIVRREDHRVFALYVEETVLGLAACRFVALGGVDSHSQQRAEFAVALQGFGLDGPGCRVCLQNLLEGFHRHAIDIRKGQTGILAAHVGWCEKGHVCYGLVVSGKEISEPGPIDHCTHVAEGVHGTDVVVN